MDAGLSRDWRRISSSAPISAPPQDGIVFQSTANTVGGVIAAGDPIMLIVPESDNLTVEVQVDPKDIDHSVGANRA